MTIETIERIRSLNDQLRSKGIGGRIMITSGIKALGTVKIARILSAVADFDDFSGDNDPHGEHDCAVLTKEGIKIIWKIDYYDPSMTKGSEDPSDPEQTTRVMTVMLAEEY
ncbi:MAG: DUF3768 domain-containing protein [Planctomycetota bacterium]|jgi:hypothetical protein